jgi:hypothetical protein
MEKMSTGLCNMLLGGVSGAGSLKTIIDGLFKLMIYDGTPPTTADSALAGNTLLCTVANAGAAVHMAAAAASGVLPMLASETWSGVNAAGGTATFYRFQTTADAGGVSLVLPRIQGTIGIGGADMNLGTNVLVISATFTVNYFVQAFVPS